MAFPPPDVAYELPVSVVEEGVKVHIVGYIHEEPDVEILARNGDSTSFYRFYLPKHARVVRDFWRSIGVVNVLKLEEGAYESKEGCGPYSLAGMAIGEDTPVAEPLPEGVEEEQRIVVGAKVLVGVRLEGRR